MDINYLPSMSRQQKQKGHYMSLGAEQLSYRVETHGRQGSLGQALKRSFFGDCTLKSDLDHTQDIWQSILQGKASFYRRPSA